MQKVTREDVEREQSFFAVVSACVISDSRLSNGAVRLYSVISSFLKSRGFCYASNAYLSAALGGKSDNTIRKYLKELESAGYVAIRFIADKSGRTAERERRIYSTETFGQIPDTDEQQPSVRKNKPQKAEKILPEKLHAPAQIIAPPPTKNFGGSIHNCIDKNKYINNNSNAGAKAILTAKEAIEHAETSDDVKRLSRFIIEARNCRTTGKAAELLVSTLAEKVAVYGLTSVEKLIVDAIAAGYRTIPFDKLQNSIKNPYVHFENERKYSRAELDALIDDVADINI